MKLLIALIFSSLTLLGVINQTGNLCAKIYATSTSAAEHTTDSADCDTCDTCHLGHCAFILATSVVINSQLPVPSFIFSEIRPSNYDFQSSLFRPPIA